MKMPIRHTARVLLSLSLACIAGCTGPTNVGGPDAYTETIVIRQDGVEYQVVNYLDVHGALLDQEVLQGGVHTSAAIDFVSRSSCSGYTTLYDQTGFSGNKICFIGNFGGTVNLASYWRGSSTLCGRGYCSNWSAAVKSYQASSGTWFLSTSGTYDYTIDCENPTNGDGSYFMTSSSSAANACEQSAQYLDYYFIG